MTGPPAPLDFAVSFVSLVAAHLAGNVGCWYNPWSTFSQPSPEYWCSVAGLASFHLSLILWTSLGVDDSALASAVKVTSSSSWCLMANHSSHITAFNDPFKSMQGLQGPT